MIASTITSLSLLALGAIAAPNPGWGHHGQNCMSDDQAYQVANNFKGLISAYTNDLANAVLSTTIHDYSDSVITLIDSGCPSGAPAGSPAPFQALGSATFDSLTNFEAGQGGQPNITFELLKVWHNCDTVTLRWRSPTPNPGPGPAPATQEQVTGIVVLETIFNGWEAAQPFLIETIYSEFNSGAWLYDLEVFQPSNCSTSAKRSIERSLPAYLRRFKAL